MPTQNTGTATPTLDIADIPMPTGLRRLAAARLPAETTRGCQDKSKKAQGKRDDEPPPDLAGDGQLVEVGDSEIAAEHPADPRAVLQRAGRSVPSRCRVAAICWGVASSPAIFSAASPGRTLSRKKTAELARKAASTGKEDDPSGIDINLEEKYTQRGDYRLPDAARTIAPPSDQVNFFSIFAR